MFESVLKKYNCEVFTSTVSIAEVAFDREMNSARIIRESGYSIRTLSDRKIGSASSNVFEKAAIEKCASDSIDAGKHTKQLPPAFSFSDKPGASKVSGTYDKKLADDAEACAESLAELALQSAEENKVLITDGRARAVSFKYRVTNSLGIDKEEAGTYATVLVDAKAITEKPLAEVPMIFQKRLYDEKEYLAWLDKKMGLVSKFVEPKKIPSGKYDILLSPSVFGPLLLDTIGFWASGKARFEETGLFKKLGEKVASGDFSATSDGTYPGGLSTFSIDAEGNKTAKNEIIRRGVFGKYFYDQKYASHFNEVSTGNAMRASSMGAEKIYAGSPFIGAGNLIVEPGKEKAENILEDMNGIFVENVGIASADSETGAFGFELRNAFIVNKGELVPARYAVYSGTVQNLLKSAILAKETEAVSESGETEFSSTCICPAALFKKQEVSGGTKNNL